MNICSLFYNLVHIFDAIDPVKIRFQICDAFFVERDTVHAGKKEITDLLLITSFLSIGQCSGGLTNAADLSINRVLNQQKNAITLFAGGNRIFLKPFSVGIKKKIIAGMYGRINV